MSDVPLTIVLLFKLEERHGKGVLPMIRDGEERNFNGNTDAEERLPVGTTTLPKRNSTTFVAYQSKKMQPERQNTWKCKETTFKPRLLLFFSLSLTYRSKRRAHGKKRDTSKADTKIDSKSWRQRQQLREERDITQWEYGERKKLSRKQGRRFEVEVPTPAIFEGKKQAQSC